MATKIDQKAYLQKYLSGPSKDKKKKKKKAIKGTGFKIIDDDIDLSKLRPLDGDELDIFDEGEDAPQIAGIIDERPEDVKKAEQFKSSSKWKVINQDDGFSSKLQVQEIKKDIKEQEKETELIFGKMYSDSEDEKKNDSDLSPPRNKNSPVRKKDKTEQKESKQDSDQSPPRKIENNIKKARKPSRWGDFGPEINTEQNRARSPSSDLSPPRKRQNKSESPPRKRNKTPDSDLSPPRKNRKHSPERNNRKYDSSPKRNSKSNYTKRRDSSDLSPPRRKRDRNTPKYKERYREVSSDLSPRRKKDRNISPKDKQRYREEKKRKHDSDSDLSPPRRKDDNRYKDSMSKRDRDSVSKRDRYSDSPPPSNKKMARTLEGKKAGLQDARQLREENDQFRRKEDEVFNRMADEVSGRNAKAVSRKGKRDTSEDRKKQKEKAERQKELDDKYKKWSKGLKQIEAHESRMQEYLHEANKPLARHRDDKDLESCLKRIERDGDPMLKYIKDKKRERGELPPERPSYKGSFPPNRFNIRPGYRWDGVDRSNGYEKKYFDQQSKKKALEEEAYKWSTEDL